MNTIEVGHVNLEPHQYVQQQQRQQQQCYASRRFELEKAESVESLSYLLDAEMRQVIVDVGQALELAYTSALVIGKSVETDGDDDTCSITSEIKHLPTLQKSIRADMVKADDKYKKQPPQRYLSFDIDNDETESDDSDETVIKIHAVNVVDADECSAPVVETCPPENSTGEDSRVQPQTEARRWRMLLKGRAMNEKTAIQVYKGSSTGGVHGMPGGSNTWNRKVSDWLLQTTRKWWKRDSASTSKDTCPSRKVRAIQQRVAKAKVQRTGKPELESKAHAAVAARELITVRDATQKIRSDDVSNGLTKVASRMIRTFFTKKQAPAPAVVA